jgi:hypothetical protein
MTTNFPTGLDALSNPTTSSALNNPSHAGQHSNANDAIEALQIKVGVDNSTVPSSLDFIIANHGKMQSFTPAWDSYGSPSLGSGTVNAYYALVNDFLFMTVEIVMAADTTDEFENPKFTLPNSMTWVGATYGLGMFTEFMSTDHMMMVHGVGTSVSTSTILTSGTIADASSTLPSWSAGGQHPFTAGDTLRFSIGGFIAP